MKSKKGLTVLFFVASILTCDPLTPAAQTPHAAPYASVSTDRETYTGPGRSTASDLAGSVINIGILAPLHGERKAEGGAMVAAAQMALHDAWRKWPPSHHRPISRVALAVEDSTGPAWAAGSDALMRLVFDDKAIAVITSTSGTDAHLCEQVGNRIGVSVLTLSADATTTQIDVPWIFRVGPSDLQQAQLLAHDIYTTRGLQRVVLITQKGYDSDRAAKVLQEAADAEGGFTVDRVVFDSTLSGFDTTNGKIEEVRPKAVVIWTDDAIATSLMPHPETQGQDRLYYLPHAINDGESQGQGFSANQAHRQAWTIQRDGDQASDARAFAVRFQRVTGIAPTITAKETYDAVMLTLRALQQSGPNRARVRDALAKTQDYHGVSGNLSFDREGNSIAPLKLTPLNAF